MQYNAEGIFFVFTANDIDNLPDPLIDRLDCWSVDLPNLSERAAIWPILIKKLKRDPANYDYSAIAAASEGFSGRQIEQVLIRAIVFAHNEGRDLEQCDIMEAVKNTQPTSLLMADVIDARRKRLAGRANPASAPEITTPVKPTTATRKIAA
jgi:SpoVK/Ycf46/Vps4 family AAA+-type ATPase